MANATTAQKNAALTALAKELRASTGAIVQANALDLADAKASGKNAAFLDRLLLDPARVEAMAKAVEFIVTLEDPIGEVTETWRRPNGLEVRKVRLPLGVVLMIYESRPNVTSDAAALCLKSGNVALLRGGSESFRSNQAIATALSTALTAAGLPPDAAMLVPDTSRESMLALLTLDGLIDLCIPRGGEGLIRFVAEHARVPVIKHYRGNCHVYVDAEVDQVVQPFDGTVEGAGVGERADMQFVDHRALQRAAFPVAVAPVEAARIDQCAGSVDAVRHPAGSRVGLRACAASRCVRRPGAHAPASWAVDDPQLHAPVDNFLKRHVSVDPHLPAGVEPVEELDSDAAANKRDQMRGPFGQCAVRHSVRPLA